MKPLNFVLIASSIFLNTAGRGISVYFQLPIWFDTVGTCVAGMALGPLAGGIVGAITSVMSVLLWDVHAIAYILVSIAVGIIVGINLHNREHVSSFTYCAAVLQATLVSVILSLIPNYAFYNGYTGNRWGDALYDEIAQSVNSKLFCAVVGEGFVDFPDRVISIGALLIGRSIFRYFQTHKGLGPQKILEDLLKLGRERILSRKSKSLGIFLLTALILSQSVLTAQADDAAQGEVVLGKRFFSDYTVTNYGIRDGLLSVQMNSLTQTPDGYLWAGGYSGLYRFNGRAFELFNPGAKLPSVSTLFTDSSGRLWIGSNDNGLSQYDPETGEIINYDMSWSMPSEAINTICEDDKGNLFVGTDSYLAMITTSGIVGVFNTIEELVNVQSLSANSYGMIAGVTEDGILFLIRDGELLETAQEESSAGKYTGAYWGRDDELLVTCSSDSAIRMHLRNDVLTKGKRINFPVRASVSNAVYSTTYDGFFCCAESGVLFLTSDGELRALESNQTNDRSITDVYIDSQRNLWVSSNIGGIFKYSDSLFLDLGMHTGLDFGDPMALLIQNGLLYIGGDQGLMVLDLETNEPVSFDFLPYFQGKEIRFLHGDESGNVYVCAGTEEFIYQITPAGTMLKLDATAEVPGETFVSIDLSLSGDIIGATDDKLVFFRKGKVRKVIGKDGELGTRHINQVLQSETGRILIATEDVGIIILQDEEIFKKINIASGLSNANVKRMIPYRDGVLYVTSNAIYYDDREMIHRLEHFPYTDNYDIFINDRDECFVMGSAGIYVVEGEKFYRDGDYSYVLMNSTNGLSRSINADSYHASKGNLLYLCARDTVLVMDTHRRTTFEDNFEIRMDTVLADGTPVTPVDGVFRIPDEATTIKMYPHVLDYEVSDLKLDITLSGARNAHFEFKQSDFDGLTLSEPESGDYTLSVKIIDELNHYVLKNKSFRLYKESHFYESRPFQIYQYAVLLLFLLVIAWTLSKISTLGLINKQYEEIRAARDEAERANRAKTKFLAQMSHEIRTPINSVLGMDEMIIRESRERNIQEYASDIHQAGRTLLALINEILDFSKIESDSMELVPVDYEMASMIHDQYNMMSHRADAKNLKLEVHVDPNMPYRYYGDDVRLRQIITNLMTNAVKYTKEGTVWLRIWGNREYENERIHVEVEDTGIGIKPENLEHLFDDYSRFDNEKNHYIEGTGLGLGIVTKLLKMMGSELKVESTYGEGSKFYFEIVQKIMDEEPIGDFNKRVIEAEQQKAKTTKGFLAPDCSILVVDDNSMNLRVFRSLLKVTQLNITEAGGGIEAVMLAENIKFDMIFMDHMMPEVDGVEAMRRIRSNPDSINRNTPIFVLTANAVTGAREQYIEAGFDGFLSKPIIFDKLEEALRTYLPQDKVLPMPEGEETEELYAGVPMPDDLPMVEGLDWAICWLHLSNMDVVTDTLNEFYELLIPQMDKLRGFYMALQSNPSYDKALDGYRIQVHAMKSSANTLGIIPLGGMAKVLEFAARDGESDKIFALHPLFEAEWLSYRDKLNGIFGIGEEVEQQDAEPWMLESFLTVIENAMEEMDVDAADSAMARMKGYRFSDHVQGLMADLSAAVTALDEDGVKEITAKMREE